MKFIKTIKWNFFLAVLLLSGHAVIAEEPAQELDGISVIGNRELPKALVIVPWKAPEPGELDGKPLQSLIDEVLGPIDRDVHKRKVSYFEQFN